MLKKKPDFVNIITTLGIAGAITLISSYFSNFAPEAKVDLQIQEVKAEIKAVDVKQEAKFDKILSGFCIIDARTCTLREK